MISDMVLSEQLRSLCELTEADIENVYGIEGLSYSCPWSRIELHSALADSTSIRLGIRVNNRLSGYAIGYLEASVFHLATLAVWPACRRLGLGSQLLLHALRQAYELGCRSSSLEVRGSNRAAIKLYQKQGFRTSATLTDYYLNPAEAALLMRLDVRSMDTLCRAERLEDIVYG